MKKVLLSLMASIALSHSAFAATPISSSVALSESLSEYEAIIGAIGVNIYFSPEEFVIDIQRITDAINILGTVKYQIITRSAHSDEFDPSDCDCCPDRHLKEYVAILEVTVDPASPSGPFDVEVVAIDPVHQHNHCHHRHHHKE